MKVTKLSNQRKKQQEPEPDLFIDKAFVKYACRVIYFCGHGSCWYEESEKTYAVPPTIYKLWTVICNFYCIAVISSEILANFRKDLTFKEENDIKQYTIGHILIYFKVIVYYFNREKISVLLKKLIEDLRIPNTNEYDRKAVRKSKIYIGSLGATLYGCLILATIDAIVLNYQQGVPICSSVPYWPPQSERGIFAQFCRFMVQTFVFYISSNLFALDCICLSALIILSYRYRSLQSYFENLRQVFEDNVDGKSIDELEEELKKNFINGIKMHSETLWCSRSLQQSIGIIYSAQVLESMGLLTMSMIKLAKVERELSFLFAHLVYIFCVLVITGCYMMAGGDITYEASLVPTSMFHGGWDLCRARARLRPLVVIAVQCSTRPVIMTAFGVFDLSYANFISVVRNSYSFFTVTF